MKEYIILKCTKCKTIFIIQSKDIKDNMICPYRCKSRLVVTGAYENVKECFKNIDRSKMIGGR